MNFLQVAAELLDPTPHPYRNDSAAWCREVLGEYVTEAQQEIHESVKEHRYTAVQSCHDVGKGLALDTVLPTPTGWTTIGEVRPGDQLLDEEGHPCTVDWVSPVRQLDCYRITFDTGTSLVCDGDHLWSTIDRLGRRPAVSDWREVWDRARTLPIRDMVDLVTVNRQRNFRVPTTRALDLPRKDLPLDPYVLGVWLGDGHTAYARLTCFDQGIVDEVRNRGWIVRGEPHSLYLSPEEGQGQATFRNAGLLGNKHIPIDYHRASIGQRLDLLRGLMDTDGFHVRGALVGIDLCNERLAADVADLIWSFGWRVTMRAHPQEAARLGWRYRMNFTPDIQPFNLARKAALWKKPRVQQSRTTCRTIESIEPVERVPTKCLAVDSPRNLFLATRACIPTHNSKSAANVSAHWVETYPSGEAFLVTTAPTDPQVKNILWREIGRTYRKGPGGRLKGRITLDAQWKIPHALGPDETIGYGRKPADTDPAAFQGIHARFVLVVIDEACGVPKAIFDAVDSLATNIDARVLAIGNPDDPSSYFAQVCKPGSGWNVLKIDALRSPNFTRERVAQYPDIRRLMIQEGIKPNDEPCPDQLRPLLVDPSWVQERIKRWGIGSPLWQAKVRGEFPEVSEDSLIEPGWVRKAQEREMKRDVLDACLGVDVARFGQDKTIIVLREGGRCRVVKEAGKSANTEVAGWVQQIGGSHISFPVRAQVDDVGVGGGVTDILRENSYPVVPMIGQTRATEMLPNGRPKFVNARSEWYWALREAFQQDLIDIAPAQNVYDENGRLVEECDDDLAAQLLAIKYGVNSQGQIWVETKDDMAKRGMPSPDRADALVYSWAMTGASWVPSVADHGGRSETGDLMKAGW